MADTHERALLPVLVDRLEISIVGENILLTLHSLIPDEKSVTFVPAFRCVVPAETLQAFGELALSMLAKREDA